MAGRAKSDGNAPFAITLDLEFLDRLNEPVRVGKAPSVSSIIRTALARFDLAHVVVMHPAQLQISVRLPARIRQQLRKTARAKHTTIGQLVRAAVESYLPQLESEVAGQMEIPIPAETAPAAPAKPAPTPPRVVARRRTRPKPTSRQSRPGKSRKRTAPRRGGMTKKRKG